MGTEGNGNELMNNAFIKKLPTRNRSDDVGADVTRLEKNTSIRPTSKLLFRGTTLDQFTTFSEKDGTYRCPSSTIWLSEEIDDSTDYATTYSKMHGSDALLIIINPDRLGELAQPDKNDKRGYWQTAVLPHGSYTTYNLTQDPLKLFEGDEQARADKIALLTESIVSEPEGIRSNSQPK